MYALEEIVRLTDSLPGSSVIAPSDYHGSTLSVMVRRGGARESHAPFSVRGSPVRRKLPYLTRIDSQFTHVTPAQCAWDEFDEPQTLALLSAFRRAHGLSREPTTIIHRHTAIDIDRSSSGARAP